VVTAAGADEEEGETQDLERGGRVHLVTYAYNVKESQSPVKRK